MRKCFHQIRKNIVYKYNEITLNLYMRNMMNENIACDLMCNQQ